MDLLPHFAPSSVDGCLCDPPYGLGFMGKDWDHGVPGSAVWAQVLRILKPGAMLLAFGGTRTHHRLMCAIEDAGFEIRDVIMWIYGSGFPKSLDIGKATGLTGFSGYGTALKPAYEPIIVAMHPCDGTFAANALKHGVAGMNIEASRVGDRKSVPASLSSKTASQFYRISGRKDAVNCYGKFSAGEAQGHGGHDPNLGRWPANIIHDGSGEVLSYFPDAPGQIADASTKADQFKTQNVYGAMKRGSHEASANRRYTETLGARRLDTGSAARFFYCAKASRAERDGSTHPTVKPVDLCRYLAKLILPPGRSTPRQLIVPFSGSGSEMLGATIAGWDHIVGIERDSDYNATAQKRLEAYMPLFAGMQESA